MQYEACLGEDTAAQTDPAEVSRFLNMFTSAEQAMSTLAQISEIYASSFENIAYHMSTHFTSDSLAGLKKALLIFNSATAAANQKYPNASKEYPALYDRVCKASERINKAQANMLELNPTLDTSIAEKTLAFYGSRDEAIKNGDLDNPLVAPVKALVLESAYSQANTAQDSESAVIIRAKYTPEGALKNPQSSKAPLAIAGAALVAAYFMFK